MDSAKQAAAADLPSGPVMFLAEVIASAIGEQVTTGDDESRNGVWWLSGGCSPATAGCKLNLRDVAAAALVALPEDVYRFARGTLGPTLELSGLEKVARAAAKVAPGRWDHDTIDNEDGRGKCHAYAVFADGRDGKSTVSLVDTINSDNALMMQDDSIPWDENGRVVSEHIAAFDPPTALRLLAQRESLLAALKSAEAFMAGFEGDELQEGIDERLVAVRAAIAQAEAA